jgi:hypothetical protein
LNDLLWIPFNKPIEDIRNVFVAKDNTEFGYQNSMTNELISLKGVKKQISELIIKSTNKERKSLQIWNLIPDL